MQDMAGDGDQVRFRAADRLVALDPQQAQEDLLGEVRKIRDGIAQPRSEKPPQAAPVLLLDFGDEGVLVDGHGCARLGFPPK